MPGVVVTTAVRTGPTAVQVIPTATAFVAGVTSRGPSGSATLISSFAQYESIYGGYTSSGYVHQTVKTFFEEGGARIYVSRAVGTDSAPATCVLLDNAGSPATAITLTAAGKGTWAHSGVLEATVTNPTVTTFVVTILLNGEEVYTSAAYASGTKADFVNEINNSPVAALYVTAASSGSTIPTAVTAKDFSNGDDGDAVAAANIVAALGYFTYDLGPGAVMAPGFYDSTTTAGLIANANTNHRIAISSVAAGSTAAEAVSDASDYLGDTDSEHLAIYWPWVKVPNGALTMTIPPEGFVAARRASTQNSRGVWFPYAGESGAASYVVGLETVVSKEDTDTVDAGSVNAIRIVQGSLRIYGARSMSTDTDNFRFITGQEVLNYIVYLAERDLEALVFQPIDGRRTLFARVASTLTAILDPMAKAGGLFPAYDVNGKQIDAGYSVVVSDALNPVTQLAQGKIVAKVGARVTGIGDKIEVEVTKSSLTSSLV
jgi:hypothetical protein